MWQKIVDFFEKKGILKIFVAFVLLAGIVALARKWPDSFIKYLAIIPAAYLLVAFLLGFAFGIYGAIKDYKEWKKSRDR